MVHIVREKGDVNLRNERGLTISHYATRHIQTAEVFRTLIELGADVNATDNDGKTPLHHAAAGSFPENLNFIGARH